MGITLNVEKYCESCPDFTPEVSDMVSANKIIHRTIDCVFAMRCREIRGHIENEINEMK